MRLIIILDTNISRHDKFLLRDLEYHGYELCKNVYDVKGSRNQIQKLLDKIQKTAEKHKSSFAIFPICRSCEKKAILIGMNIPKEKDFFVI